MIDRCVVLGVVSLLSVACSSSYTPARSPRIATIQSGGMYTLVRDGKEYSVGLFGGGLEDAVAGNPAAEEHASTFKTLSIAGWSFYLAGLGSGVAGVYVLSANHSGSNDSTSDAAGIALGLGGIGALVTSLVLLANAPPHLWDAVNIYNDGVDAAYGFPRMPPPGFVPPPPALRAPGAVPAPVPPSVPSPGM